MSFRENAKGGGVIFNPKLIFRKGLKLQLTSTPQNVPSLETMCMHFILSGHHTSSHICHKKNMILIFRKWAISARIVLVPVSPARMWRALEVLCQRHFAGPSILLKSVLLLYSPHPPSIIAHNRNSIAKLDEYGSYFWAFLILNDAQGASWFSLIKTDSRPVSNRFKSLSQIFPVGVLFLEIKHYFCLRFGGSGLQWRGRRGRGAHSASVSVVPT